ncbi:MarR family winged helix-turn-helix transcriptional regulator [Gallaecimonas xiamenensis]|uniref:Transcription regulator protein n=1 Tax=Gallaecimonas xiamenensis 3-C-1 TaxID=745411 RepID=K2ITX8_9GAMM|nr:MarR family transcriptional regulator [Gallaecimonas xiamenensis]EKE73676.1 transcription regulator protein [Gallaecimonas xiamenensis 3-C-1]
MVRARTPTCQHEETVDPVGDLGWLLVTARNQLMRKVDKVLAPLDLTTAQYGVVASLAKGRADTPAQLCDLLDYDRGAMTRLLDRVEAKGLILRLPNEADRRCVTLKLTDKGLALYPQVQPLIRSVYLSALGCFDEAEAEAKQLATLLCRLIANLD